MTGASAQHRTPRQKQDRDDQASKQALPRVTGAWRTSLSEDDRRVIGEALHAITEGPFVSTDREFILLVTVTRDEAAELAGLWPDVGDELRAWHIVHRGLAVLWGYPHRQHGSWQDYSSVPLDSVRALSRRLDVTARADGELQILLERERDAWFAGLTDERVTYYLSICGHEKINPEFRRRTIEEVERRGLEGRYDGDAQGAPPNVSP